MTEEELKQQKENLLLGLKIAYEKMLEFKRYKKTKVVVMRDGKIVHLDP
jgi:hypothetical protein